MAFKPLKKTLRQLLEEGKLEEIAEMTTGRRRVLGTLVPLTFDADLRIAWRAIEAMGLSAERLSRQNRAYVKDHMRKLYWLITEESGAVFWRAPECMAECGVRLPELLKEFIPIAFHLLETFEEEDLEHFRPGALYAVARLADVVSDELESMIPLVVDASTFAFAAVVIVVAAVLALTPLRRRKRRNRRTAWSKTNDLRGWSHTPRRKT